MKIVFLGTDKFVDPVPEILQKNYDVLSIRNPQDFESNIKEIKKFSPDLFVVASFGLILSREILALPKLGSINIHPSLLPKYRGPSPIQTAILNGDKNTGVTIIKMDTEVDHGPILFQKDTGIESDDSFQSLAVKLFKLAADNLKITISNYVSSENNLTKQDDSQATFTERLERQSGYIDATNPPSKDKLERMIRAYFPWPSTWTKFTLGGKEKIIKLLPKGRIQVEGKKEMTYKDFINGYSEGEELLSKLGLS